MPHFSFGSRYSRWDGTQQVPPFDADALMRAMSEDLMQDGDLNRALQRLFRWGFEQEDGSQVAGLRELLQRLRERRQEQLDRYDLNSVFDDIKERLEQIKAAEAAGIQQRLDSLQQPEHDPQADSGDADSPSGDQAATPPSQGDSRQSQRESQPAPASDQQAESRHAAMSASGQAGAGQSPGDGQQQNGEDGAGAPDPDMARMLEQLANRRREQLARVPEDPAGAIRALQEYDFMDPGARQQFQELLAMLQQQVLQQTFQGMEQSLSQMSPEDVGDLRQMMHDLNELLESRQQGTQGPDDFTHFMHKWGHYFGPDVQNLDDLMAQMQRQMGAMRQLMQSMSAEQRGQLQNMMQSLMQDAGLRQEMDRLSANLGLNRMPPEEGRGRYRFGGEESLSLAEAMRMMDRLRDYDEMEQQLRDVRDWNDLAAIDDEKFRALMGDENEEQMRQLQELTRLLEDAGYIKRGRRGYELTPQGVRKIGEKALQDIFADLKRERIGQHALRREGGAGDRTDVTKPYEFGDPFLLDIPKTIMNAVQRGPAPGAAPAVAATGGRLAVPIAPRDFEVFRTEYSTRSATVLMVDMSRSMLYNGCFNAAKKVALAMDSLIRGKYPRDHFSIIGFSYMAQEITPTELPTLDWNEHNYGTNMQHGFQLARQILNRHKGSNRQIIIITDGEPTAHFEHGQVRFSYPPTPRTFQETLREVIRCTKDDITINTFMLERSAYMIQFVNDLMRINKGRVFAATPDRLGEYILVDYVANKRKRVG